MDHHSARAVPLPGIMGHIDRILGNSVAMVAAVLVMSEIIVLLSGVVSRYVFHKPIVWSDELASLLFIWLAMLGSAVAYHKAEHMRMTVVVSKAAPPMKAYLEAISLLTSLIFLILLLIPAIDFAYEERLITTPALEISNAWRASALPVGLAMMLVFGIARLNEHMRWSPLLMALGTIVILCLALWVAKPILALLGKYNLLLFFVFLVGALVFAGVPIAFAFGLATFGYIALTTRLPTFVIIGRMDEA